MTQKILVCLLLALVFGGTRNIGAGPHLVATMGPEDIQEALRLASDEPAARRLFKGYVIQTRSGLGTGPLIGSISTPFSRVVLAALTARQEGRTLTLPDVTPDLLTPELHVIVLPQAAAYEESVTATVQAVGIKAHGTGLPAHTILPARTVEAAAEQYVLHGIAAPKDVLLAAFPLSVVEAGNHIRVSFSHVVSGSSALTNCKDCVVPLDIARIR